MLPRALSSGKVVIEIATFTIRAGYRGESGEGSERGGGRRREVIVIVFFYFVLSLSPSLPPSLPLTLSPHIGLHDSGNGAFKASTAIYTKSFSLTGSMPIWKHCSTTSKKIKIIDDNSSTCTCILCESKQRIIKKLCWRTVKNFIQNFPNSLSLFLSNLPFQWPVFPLSFPPLLPPPPPRQLLPSSYTSYQQLQP